MIKLETHAPHDVSWSELERLVADAEADRSLQQVLRQSRSDEELLLIARGLGYYVTSVDLRLAEEQDRRERRQQG
jgi:hypothetical protein